MMFIYFRADDYKGGERILTRRSKIELIEENKSLRNKLHGMTESMAFSRRDTEEQDIRKDTSQRCALPCQRCVFLSYIKESHRDDDSDDDFVVVKGHADSDDGEIKE